MIVELKTRELFENFAKYRKQLNNGEIDKIVLRGVKGGKAIEMRVIPEISNGKTPAQKAIEFCKNLGPGDRVAQVNINILDNFIKG